MKYFDNDMDELFSKAGTEYPLNTGKKDWNAVQKALAVQEEAAPAKTTSGKNFKRFYPLLILLLLLPVLFYVLDNNANRLRIANNTNESNSFNNQSDEPNVNNGQANKSNDNPPTNANSANTNGPNTTDLNNNINGINSNRASNLNTNSANPNNLNTKNPGNNQAIHLNKISLNNNGSNKKFSSNNIANENINPTVNNEKNLERFLFPFEHLNEHFTLPYAAIPEPQVKNEPASAPPSTKQKLNKRYSSFYYGVMAGPDFSTIKYQDIRNVGSGLGLLLGYRFSEHWSIEASGYWSMKKYYTDGKYFNKANANIPPYVDLYFLNGGCRMIELPLDVRYEFAPGKNSFFVTAGLNSYFMKKESYDYKADAAGSVYNGHRNYKNPGSNIFSNLQISGGYQHKLFSKFIVRIEPYLQVPLGEVGIGKMPITSGGVHFGLVRETK